MTPVFEFPIVAYHGCSRSVAEEVSRGRSQLLRSANSYDWLGEGLYFWVGSYARALDWAQKKAARGKLERPTVIAAAIDLRNCLRLTDLGMSNHLATSYEYLKVLAQTAGLPLPANSHPDAMGTFRFRTLDCAVLQNLHAQREAAGLQPFDTVLGAFEEGPPAYEGAGIRKESHIQLAVRNLSCIRDTRWIEEATSPPS
jgi:hypothetical protein